MPVMSNPSAAWAASAVNEFRAVARATENPTTRQLAVGLAHLAEAIRSLDPTEVVAPRTFADVMAATEMCERDHGEDDHADDGVGIRHPINAWRITRIWRWSSTTPMRVAVRWGRIFSLRITGAINVVVFLQSLERGVVADGGGET
jgi:hypothetical protein